MEDALDAVAAAFADPEQSATSNLPRQRLHLGTTRLNVMGGAIAASGRLGVKAYTGGENFCVLLFEGDGRLLAAIRGRYLSLCRTGAATGVATRLLACDDSSSVGMVGAGFQATAQLRAIALVRPITSVKVWSRTAERATAFARQMGRELDLGVEPVGSPREAVEELDVVVTATTSVDPVVEGSWVSSVTHLNLVGANQVHRREVDAEVLGRSGVVVVDDLRQAEREAGELLAPVDRGVLLWEQVQLLGSLVAGGGRGREHDDEVTVFKSLGVGIEDVAVASLVYDRALLAGLGHQA